MGMDATAAQIAGAGFPFPLLLAWLAAFFEIALALAFLTGLFFSEAALVAIGLRAVPRLLLPWARTGWRRNPMEFGFFVDHFIFIAGLLFAAVHGPGNDARPAARRAQSELD